MSEAERTTQDDDQIVYVYQLSFTTQMKWNLYTLCTQCRGKVRGKEREHLSVDFVPFFLDLFAIEFMYFEVSRAGPFHHH